MMLLQQQVKERLKQAHEMTITLSRENDELRSRVKVLIEDNNKLIDLYERAVTEINDKTHGASAEGENRVQEDNTDIHEKDINAKKLRDLEHQLMEMHEENEKLMGLYEKAMQERIASVVIDSHEETVTETDIDEKDAYIQDMEHQLLELHEENERLMSLYEKAMQERDEFKKIISSGTCRNDENYRGHDSSEEITNSSGGAEITEMETDGTSKEVQANQQDLESLNTRALEIQERRSIIDKKFSALKFSLSSFSSSTPYFEEQELKARSRVDSSTAFLNQKKEELIFLEFQKAEIEAARRKIEETEVEVRSNLASVESKLEEENMKLESNKVLLAIDNFERAENWKLGTKGF